MGDPLDARQDDVDAGADRAHVTAEAAQCVGVALGNPAYASEDQSGRRDQDQNKHRREHLLPQ
jgi:hypothetical protein